MKQNGAYIPDGWERVYQADPRGAYPDLESLTEYGAGSHTQNTIAREYIVHNRHQLRYDHYRGCWYVFDKVRGIWRRDEIRLVLNEIRGFTKSLDDSAKPKFGRANDIKGIEFLARCDIDVAVTSSEWDVHTNLLGTPGAYIDLRNGSHLRPDPDLLITQSTIVAVEDGVAELWLNFLHQATAGDQDYIDFIQRMLGYCLTGDIKEHALFFLYGPGGTGKSTLVNTVAEILGAYAWAAPMEMLTASRFDRHPTELAALKGRRFVTATETEQGRAWAEAKIKQLTGGDPVTARFMKKDFFEFDPTHKLVVVGNHAPSMQSCGNDMRRRFHVLPLEYVPQRIDQDLPAKLVREAGRILAWMIEGAVKWQERGLDPPANVQAATDQYFEAQNVFTDWLEAETVQAPALEDTSARLYTSYSKYMSDLNEPDMSSKAFGMELSRRGFDRKHLRDGRKQYRGWTGLKVLS